MRQQGASSRQVWDKLHTCGELNCYKALNCCHRTKRQSHLSHTTFDLLLIWKHTVFCLTSPTSRPPPLTLLLNCLTGENVVEKHVCSMTFILHLKTTHTWPNLAKDQNLASPFGLQRATQTSSLNQCFPTFIKPSHIFHTRKKFTTCHLAKWCIKTGYTS